MPADTVDQNHANAGRDLIGGNVYQTSIILPAIDTEISQAELETLVKKLQVAIDDNDTINHMVRSMEYFHRKREAKDGIVGLEAKLTKGGRETHRDDAIDQKLEFERLLEEWSYYASAQEILAHLLVHVQRNFMLVANPHLEDVPPHVLDQIVDQQVLGPILAKCAKIPQFEVNLNVALGMLYWLAEQCYVKWHK